MQYKLTIAHDWLLFSDRIDNDLIPKWSADENLQEIDRNPNKLSSLVNNDSATNLLVHDLSLFVPFGINLDPYLRKLVRDANARLVAQQHRHAMLPQAYSMPYLPTVPSAPGGLAMTGMPGVLAETPTQMQMQMQMNGLQQHQHTYTATAAPPTGALNHHVPHAHALALEQHQQYTLPAVTHAYAHAHQLYFPHTVLQQLPESAGSSLNLPPHHEQYHQQLSMGAALYPHVGAAGLSHSPSTLEHGAAGAGAGAPVLSLLADVCSHAEVERLAREVFVVPLRRWTFEQLRLVFELVLRLAGAELDTLLQRCRADKLNGLVIHLAINTDINQLNHIFLLKFGDWLLLKSLLSVSHVQYKFIFYELIFSSLVHVRVRVRVA